LIPHTSDTFPQSLTNFQLQVEHWNTFSCQHNKVRDQECNCKQLKTAILQYFSIPHCTPYKCKPHCIPNILCLFPKLIRIQSEDQIARRNVIEIKLKKLLKNFLYILKSKLHKIFTKIIAKTQLAATTHTHTITYTHTYTHKYIYIYLFIETVCRYTHTHNAHLNAHQAAPKLSFPV
jgi:hypothetical protein